MSHILHPFVHENKQDFFVVGQVAEEILGVVAGQFVDNIDAVVPDRDHTSGIVD